MKVRMGMDEKYPVYSIEDTFGEEDIEVGEATAERWKRVQDDYANVQDEMKAAWKAHWMTILTKEAHG